MSNIKMDKKGGKNYYTNKACALYFILDGKLQGKPTKKQEGEIVGLMKEIYKDGSNK